MEIFQTIWNALTIENLLLTKIITSFLMFIELSISMLIFTTILDIRVSNSKKLLYIFTLSIVGILTLWIIPTPFNTFLNIITCPILVYFLFKSSLLKSILAEIIPYIIFVLLGTIIVNLYTILSNIPTSSFVNIPIHKITFSCIMYTCAYFIYLYFKHFNINLNFTDKLSNKNSRVLFVNFCIGIIAIAIQSYLTTFYNDFTPFYVTFSSVLVIFIYFIISICSLSRTNKLEITTENLEEERLYNKTLTILYDNIRGFKHDFNNIVQALGGYISTNNIDGLKDYYSDLVADCQKLNNLAILDPELINNSAVYSLLTSKYHIAEENGITMNFEIFLDLGNLKIKNYDLTRMLGILIDNAIEASLKCDKKIINISIRQDNKVERSLFIIENTYSNKDVNTDRIFEKGYTSKQEKDNKNHGLGLWEVRKILKKNNNLNLFTTKNNKYFKQQLEIY